MLACSAPAGDETDAAAGNEGDETNSHDHLVGNNALSFNALSFNALSFNALSFNALSFNTLSPGALASLQAPGEDGALFRTLVRYTVGCALEASRSFDFTWVDAEGVTREESYPGQLGIADGWATGALDDQGKRMVSACLAARTNYQGMSVTISIRSHRRPLREMVGGEEHAAYPFLEGAFWGSLFQDTPRLRACYAAANVDRSRAAQRDCATGHLNADGSVSPCGPIEVVGSCEALCQLFRPNQYYLHCDDPDLGNTQDVITTALP